MRRFKPGPYDQLMLFGDSITEQSANQELGFAFMPALQDAYIRRLDVINRGFSGYNTAQAVKALPSFMPTPEQASVVFFGANDACLPGDEAEQHVPLDQYKRNLELIISHPSVKAQSSHLLLITPPPIDEHSQEVVDRQKGYTNLRRSASNTRQYANACVEVGTQNKVSVLNFWEAVMIRAGWEQGKPLPGSRDLPPSPYLKRVLRDGLHLSPEGYKILFTEVKRTIEESWPEESSGAISPRFPSWIDAPR